MSERGLTRVELIELCGRRPDGNHWIDSSRLSNWLRSKSARPDARNVRIIARALGVDEAEALDAAGYDRDGMIVRTKNSSPTAAIAALDLTDEEFAQVVTFVAGLRAAKGRR